MKGMSENKILIVSNMYPNEKYPSYGIFVKNFCNGLDELAIKYDLVVMSYHKSLLIKAYNFLLYYLNVFFKIIRNNYDIVYVHYASHSAIPILMAKKIKKFKLFTNCHGSDVVPENKLQEFYQRNVVKILNNSYCIIVPSEYFKQLVSKKYNIEKNKIEIFPSAGVDLSIFHPFSNSIKEEIRESLGLHADFQYIGFVGRLIPSKKWNLFIDLAANLVNVQGKRNVRFIVVGSGPDKEKLESMIKKMNLCEYFMVMPFQTQMNLSKIYNMFDVFTFPSFRDGESLGLVAIEAMACGVPVVATDHAAPKYYIQNGINGYKFIPDDVDSLSKNVALILENKELKERMRKGALETACNYSHDKILGMLKNILER